MHVNKASAGSGKTYTLAHTYIDLLKDELSYRHILAVTFTNKATAEMKERILEYLADDPASRDKLVNILHDYSAFSVSTIDRFFQRALKAFAREIGQVADYQVELDRDSITQFHTDSEMSPAGFSNSVHNAAAGAFSIFRFAFCNRISDCGRNREREAERGEDIGGGHWLAF